ncbi:MAG: phosphotransferase [Kineosporiaceae bacterium]
MLRLWSDALATPIWDGPSVWLHGDLHPGNLLVHAGRLSGVVDFGDITAGDPATDLSVAWMLLPRSADDAFRGAYAARSGRSLDDATWRRARGWALALSVAFVGHSVDNPMIAGIGRRTLHAVLADTAQADTAQPETARADASQPHTTPSPVDRLPQ